MPAYAFKLNGAAVKADSWDPAQPLLYVLRNTFGLHGPKFGCGLGQCGACTVLVDGRATRSCITTVQAAQGKSVTTLEGLGSGDKLDDMQAAFVAEAAAQCGYCTNGMILQAKDLVSHTPNVTVERVKQGLANNLCKCGTHARILKAVMRVVEGGVA